MPVSFDPHRPGTGRRRFFAGIRAENEISAAFHKLGSLELACWLLRQACLKLATSARDRSWRS
jgi:hypothetical protein